MDAAFKSAAYPAYTTNELREMLRRPTSYVTEVVAIRINAEIARRDAAAAGEASKMTNGERLRFARTGEAR